MSLGNAIFLIFLCTLTSCQWGTSGKNATKTNIIKDTLQYTYKTLKQREHGYENKPDSESVYFELKYPVFKGEKALNDSLASFLCTNYSNENYEYTVKGLATSYLNEQKTDPRHSEYIRYSLELAATVTKQDSNLLLIDVEGNYFWARTAHERTVTHIYFLNWNTKTSKPILMNDIFVKGYSNKLDKIAEIIFRKKENLNATDSLQDYRFEDAKFSLPDNFQITPVGIKFLYNSGDIKSETADPIELLIPYTQIKSLLRPNTVVTQYIK